MKSSDHVSLVASHVAGRIIRSCARNCARNRRLEKCALCAVLLAFAVPISGQEIDAIVTSENRKPATIAD